MPQMFGHSLVRRSLEDALSELFQRPIRAGQRQALAAKQSVRRVGPETPLKSKPLFIVASHIGLTNQSRSSPPSPMAWLTSSC